MKIFANRGAAWRPNMKYLYPKKLTKPTNKNNCTYRCSVEAKYDIPTYFPEKKLKTKSTHKYKCLQIQVQRRSRRASVPRDIASASTAGGRVKIIHRPKSMEFLPKKQPFWRKKKVGGQEKKVVAKQWH